MYCPYCGTQSDNSSKFCACCGANLEPQQTENPVITEPAPQEYTPSYATPAPSTYGYDFPTYETTSKSKLNPAKIIIPVIAVIVAAAIAVGAFFVFGKKNYYISSVTQYYYDENGEVSTTYKMLPYGKFMFPLEVTYDSEGTSFSLQFVLDKKDRLIEYKYSDEEEDEKYSIDIEYEKKKGKHIGTGSYKNDDGEKTEIEIIYESDDNFTFTIKEDGELSTEYTCYIDDDGYSVTEMKYTTTKQIQIYDGARLIAAKQYEREDEDDDFELMYSTASTYNKDGYLTEYVSKSNYDDEEYTYKTVYERNKNNVPTSIKWYENGEKTRDTKIYKEDDDKIVLEVLNEDNETEFFYEYGFDGKNLTYEKILNADKDTDSEAIYNQNGLLEEQIYYSDGNKYQKSVYEYEKR